MLGSPLHGAVSGQLMLLSYTGGRRGRRYSFPFPIGYFASEEGDALSFSSRRWAKETTATTIVSFRPGGHDKSSPPVSAWIHRWGCW